jgi:Tol biopolymer transport system component
VQRCAVVFLARIKAVASLCFRRANQHAGHLWGGGHLHEYEPFIAPDQSYLIFMAAGRPDGRGGGDLYISYHKDGVWSKAQNLGEKINSPRDEYSPKISPDGKYFFFASARGRRPPEKPLNYQELLAWLRGARNGLGDIYQVERSAIQFQEGLNRSR